ALAQFVGDVGIRQQLASHGDEVGLAIGDDSVGFVGLVATERDDRYRHRLLHDLRVHAEGAGLIRRVCVRRVAVGGAGGDIGVGVGGDVYGIDAFVDGHLDDLQLLFELLTVGLVVFDRVDANPQWGLVADAFAQGPD